jgi:hypothetical protein
MVHTFDLAVGGTIAGAFSPPTKGAFGGLCSAHAGEYSSGDSKLSGRRQLESLAAMAGWEWEGRPLLQLF